MQGIGTVYVNNAWIADVEYDLEEVDGSQVGVMTVISGDIDETRLDKFDLRTKDDRVFSMVVFRSKMDGIHFGVTTVA